MTDVARVGAWEGGEVVTTMLSSGGGRFGSFLVYALDVMNTPTLGARSAKHQCLEDHPVRRDTAAAGPTMRSPRLQAYRSTANVSTQTIVIMHATTNRSRTCGVPTEKQMLSIALITRSHAGLY